MSDAILLLHNSLAALMEFTDPKVTELVRYATSAADVVVDQLQNFAADIKRALDEGDWT